MGFIKGRAFPIINTLAKRGNTKAKNLLLNASKLEQDKVDNIVAELLTQHVEKPEMKKENELKFKITGSVEDKKADKRVKEEKVEKEEEVEEEPKGDLGGEIAILIKKEKKLLEEYKENPFAKDLKQIIDKKENFIRKLEEVLKDE